MPALPRRLAAEALGSALLLAVIVGSGIMGERLAGGNDAIALLANSLATGCGLAVLILIFGPVSGAHFNPAVTLVAALDGDLDWRDVAPYVLAQIAAALIGVAAAHAMFDLPAFFASTKVRTGMAQWFAEAVATFGLVMVVVGCGRQRIMLAPFAIAAYITAAYWFTASTSFANPAVTIARSLTDSFAGIRPNDAPGFIVAQLAGALSAMAASRYLWPRREISS
jgi:glycerol uptake facilitator-like aquaporin